MSLGPTYPEHQKDENMAAQGQGRVPSSTPMLAGCYWLDSQHLQGSGAEFMEAHILCVNI